MGKLHQFIRQNDLFICRIVTLLISGFCVLLSMNLIIKHFGITAFGQYSLLISLSSLLPFLNLGVKTLIYNQFSNGNWDKKSNYKYSDQEVFSLIFYTLLVFGQLFFLALLFTSILFFQFNSDDLIAGLMVLFITCISAPFSSGNFLLNAKNRIFENLLISLSTPLLTLAGALLVVNSDVSFRVAAITPIFGYFISCILGFVLSKAYRFLKIDYLNSNKLKFFVFGEILKVGLLTIAIESIFQIAINSPRYFFAFSNRPTALAHYSILLSFFLPIASILLPKITQISVTDRLIIRRSVWYDHRKSLFKISIILGSAFSVLFLFLNLFNLKFTIPNTESNLFLTFLLVLWVNCQLEINSSVNAKELKNIVFAQLSGFLLMFLVFLFNYLFQPSWQVCPPLFVFLATTSAYIKFSNRKIDRLLIGFGDFKI